MVLILRDGALPPCGICVEGSIVQPCSILHLGMQIAKSCKIPDPLFLSTSKRGFRGCYGPGCAQKKLITTITSINILFLKYMLSSSISKLFIDFLERSYFFFSTAIYLYIHGLLFLTNFEVN